MRPAVAFTLFVASSACGQCVRDTLLPTAQQWVEQRLSSSTNHGLPYQISEPRRKALVAGAQKLKLGMTKHETEELLSSPDFEDLRTSGKLYPREFPGAVKTCWFQRGYYIFKRNENLADRHDEGLFLSFDRDGKLQWIAPLNIKELTQRGSPVPE